MKTLHRAAYEVLTPEEYKEFCRIPKELFGCLISSDWSGKYDNVIGQSFTWDKAPQSLSSHKDPIIYWGEIYSRINGYA